MYANLGNRRACLKLSDVHRKLISRINIIADYNETEATKCLLYLS